MLLRIWNNWNHFVSRNENNDVATLEHSLAFYYYFYLIKSDMHLPYDPTFPLPGIYPREMKTYIHSFPPECS